MKVFIIDTFYGPYLENLYARNQEGFLAQKPWIEQKKAHFCGGFGTSDSYSHGLKVLGVEAIEIVANSMPLQQAWAKEYQPKLLEQHTGVQQLFAILEAQIRWFHPTVLYIQDINWLPTAFIQQVKPLVQIVVGQNACPLAPTLDLSPYDLLVTSLPNYVNKFQSMGVKAAYFPIGFDERLLKHHRTSHPRSYDLTFIGGLGGYHNKGTKVLEAIAEKLPIQVWGYGGQQLPRESEVKKRWMGEAWANEMYDILAKSQITINRHIDIAESYACNMRLYEATGMGACLITEHKSNIASIFRPDEEIITYESEGEAISKIKELIRNPNIAQKIALQGQRRTLKDHTYQIRMQELVELIKENLPKAIKDKEQFARQNINKPIVIPVCVEAESFSTAKAWAEQVRNRSSRIHIEFHFIMNERIESPKEKVWMTEPFLGKEGIVTSFFDCIKKPSMAIIIKKELGLQNTIESLFLKEAAKRGIIVKYIKSSNIIIHDP